MADITRVKVTLNTGAAVTISDSCGSLVTVAELGSDLNISNAVSQTIASFSKSAVAYWTTDLAEIT